MATFVINEGYGNEEKVSDARWYRQEGEFFVFYRDESDERTAVVFTIAASAATSITTRD